MKKTFTGGVKLTNKSDIYVVTALNEVVYGGNGNDNITGGDGNDHLNGQNGSDTLYGGLGNDCLNGGNGKDVLAGGEGDDRLYGNNGKDRLMGGLGEDWLYGGNARDILCGNANDDHIFGGNGADSIRGGSGVDIMAGGRGPDKFIWRDGDIIPVEDADPSYPQGLIETKETEPVEGDAPANNVWVRSAENGGSVGVTTDYPQSGEGSLLLAGSDATADGGYKASATYTWDPLAGLDTVDVGDASDDTTLGSLSTLGYDWYRDSASTTPDNKVPAVQLLVDLDGDMTTTGDQITLTYDPSGGSPVPEDTWNTTSLDLDNPSGIDFDTDFGTSVNLDTALKSGVVINDGISDIGTLDTDSLVYGVQVSIGGTTGEQLSAVDNVNIGFHDDTANSWNFEVAPSDPDIIVDFTSHSDKLVLTDLLPGFDTGDDINDFVKAETDGGTGDTTVSVNGDGIGTDWTAVVILKNATVDLSTDVIA